MEDVSLLLIDVFLKERNLAEQQWVSELKKKIKTMFLKSCNSNIQILNLLSVNSILPNFNNLDWFLWGSVWSWYNLFPYFNLHCLLICFNLRVTFYSTMWIFVKRCFELYSHIKQMRRWCSLLQLVENCLFRVVFCHDISWLHFEARVRKFLCTCWAMWMMPSYFHYSYNRDWQQLIPESRKIIIFYISLLRWADESLCKY